MVEATLYESLGVPPDASAIEIKSAYRRAAREHHPDANPDDPSGHERFQEIVIAYETLADPVRRADYDASLVAAEAGYVEEPIAWDEPGAHGWGDQHAPYGWTDTYAYGDSWVDDPPPGDASWTAWSDGPEMAPPPAWDHQQRWGWGEPDPDYAWAEPTHWDEPHNAGWGEPAIDYVDQPAWQPTPPPPPPPVYAMPSRMPLGVSGRIAQVLIVLLVMWAVSATVGASLGRLGRDLERWWDAERQHDAVVAEEKPREADVRRAEARLSTASDDARSSAFRLAAVPLSGAIAWPAAAALLRRRSRRAYYLR